MGRDLLKRPYGRFFYLPKILADRGHQVTLVTLSYANDKMERFNLQGIDAWSIPAIPFGPLPYLCKIRQLSEEIKPDWIVGCSDTYYGIWAERLARQYGAKSAIDAYDNYESYLPWFAWLHKRWRKALRQADLVTAAGPQLAKLMGRERKQAPIIVPMAADPSGFIPMDRRECRSSLGLPLEAPILGYFGSIYKNRGVETLFKAYSQLKKTCPDCLLLMSGRKGKGMNLPDDAIWLGYIPDKDVPIVLNAVDVLVVVNRNTRFGKYSYPVKLYEAIQCGIPAVASATNSARWILNSREQHLANIDDADNLVEKINHALCIKRMEYGQPTSWEKSTDAFESGIYSIK